jgi:hypothetical protein
MPADNQKNHDAILGEAKRFREKCITVNAENRRLAVDDLTFLSGKHWDSRDAALREKEGRPVLTIDKLSTFVRQIKNDQRINKPSIKVHPVDDESDPETAKVRQGMIRYIEYSSNASIAYDTAIGCASETGLGYFRIITDYESEDSFDVVPRFVRIRNPLTVHFDPDSIEGDGSDARKVLVEERLGVTEFCSKYPESEIAKTRKTTGNAARDDMDDILVAEYIRVEDDPDELILLSNGEKGWKSDLLALPPDLTIVNTRKSARRTVRNYKIAGKCVGDDSADFGEVIEEADVPCKWIPVFPVYGNEIDIEGKVIRSGVIRGAKDPSRMYDYWMTSATEEYALRTKTPFIGAEGQFEGYEAQWAQANRRSSRICNTSQKPWAVSLRLLLRASLWPMCRSAPSRWPCTHRTTSRRRRACLMLPWAREVRQRQAFRSASKSAKVASPISTTRTTSIVPCCKPADACLT